MQKTKETYLIDRYELSKYHLAKVNTKYKTSGKKKEIKRSINPIRFNKCKWGICTPSLIPNSTGILVYCGLCVKAKDLGSQTWLNGKVRNQGIWIKGTNNWKN